MPDTDKFDISGTYSANDNAPSISFYATATYLGNSTNTSAAGDTLSVDLLQNFAYNNDPDGTYSYTATLSQSNVTSGSYVTADLSFDNESIGEAGPFYGTGSQTYRESAYLSGLCNPSPADFNYTFYLAPDSPAVPEPANAALLGIGVAILGGMILRRKAANSL